MFRKTIKFIMPISVGIWLGIGISHFPEIALYVNMLVMAVIFICALLSAWYIHKDKKDNYAAS